MSLLVHKLSFPILIERQSSCHCVKKKVLTIFCFITVDLVEVCHPNNCNVGLLAYSPLAGGVLTGKYLDVNTDISKSRLNLFPGYMARYNASLAKV